MSNTDNKLQNVGAGLAPARPQTLVRLCYVLLALTVIARQPRLAGW